MSKSYGAVTWNEWRWMWIQQTLLTFLLRQNYYCLTHSQEVLLIDGISLTAGFLPEMVLALHFLLQVSGSFWNCTILCVLSFFSVTSC